MARRHASLVLAAIIVIARIVSGGATAGASSTSPREESVRAEVAHHGAPSRKVRSLSGGHARVAARNQALGAWIEALPAVVEEPPRTLVPPTVVPPSALVVAPPAPTAQARAPPAR